MLKAIIVIMVTTSLLPFHSVDMLKVKCWVISTTSSVMYKNKTKQKNKSSKTIKQNIHRTLPGPILALYKTNCKLLKIN